MGEEELLQRLSQEGPIATVGDMTSATLHRLGMRVHMAVVDFRTKRAYDPAWRDATSSLGEVTVSLRNEAATISAEMYNAIIDAWASESSTRLVVEGEEDLATLPAILHAPEGATVIYGIPDTGLCLVRVDEGARNIVADVLMRFDHRTHRAAPREG
jgi:uncharacterized protein (UPF0218 family)